MTRKKKEKGNKLDRHEENKRFLSELAEFYKRLIQRQVLAKWVVLDGERSIEEVFSEIKKIV